MPRPLAIRPLSRIVGLAAALGACSAPRATFDLPGESRLVTHVSSRRAVVVIREPEAVLLTNSDRIVVRSGRDQVSYLAGAQWSDRLPKLLQARFSVAFERAGLTPGPAGGGADAILATTVRRFEIDEARQAAVVEIAAQIVDDGSEKVRAAGVFVGEAPAPHTKDGEAARALDSALGVATDRLVAFAARRI
jgi:cholesterol transport system auxiliary component